MKKATIIFTLIFTLAIQSCVKKDDKQIENTARVMQPYLIRLQNKMIA